MMTFELVGRRPSVLRPRDVAKTATALSYALHLRRPHRASLRFVGESAMQKLNRESMGKNCSTDVLSFPAGEIPVGRSEPVEMGDIVICPTYARREAKRRGIPPREELLRLLVHGTLHLAGYDHATARQEEQMFGLQEDILERAYE